MKPLWILIANAARGRCFECSGDERELELLESFSHPPSRDKGIDLAADRPGREDIGPGRASSAYTPRADPRDKEHASFARELAHFVNGAVAAHRCGALLIVASNPFLGEVRSHLSREAQRQLTGCIAKDLTGFDGRELQARLELAAHPQS